jgi:leucine dehydrogenase
MRACANRAFGATSLKDLKVVIQGLGSVSYYLLEHLMADGAKVVACDIDPASIDRAVKRYGIEIVNPERIYDVPGDIFAPCALGAVINSETLSQLKTKIVAGAANNQLATAADGYELMRRGVLYAPDYAINAGGLINIYHEGSVAGGYSRARAFEHVAQIGSTISEILQRAIDQKQPTFLIADQIAEERVSRGRSQKV